MNLLVSGEEIYEASIIVTKGNKNEIESVERALLQPLTQNETYFVH